MINTVRFSLLIAIVGLYAAAFLTWEPPVHDDSAPDHAQPSNEVIQVLNGWAEKVPSLKEELQDLALSLKENLSNWKDSAAEKASLLSEFSWSATQPETQETTDTQAPDSMESLTTLLSQLKERLGDINSEEMKAKLNAILDKAKSLPENDSTTKPSASSTPPQ